MNFKENSKQKSSKENSKQKAYKENCNTLHLCKKTPHVLGQVLDLSQACFGTM